MPALNNIVLGSWIVFAFYWIVSAANVKKDTDTRWWRQGRFFSFGRLVIVVSLALVFPHVIRKIFSSSAVSSQDMLLRAFGTGLAVFGIGFAIWARRHLGKNWSSHPAVKEGHELVTTGPYRFIRHPIYTGMLTAIIGSELASFSPVWFFFFIVMGTTILYRVPVEERMMLQTFPGEYPAYKESTNALIPFIW